MSEELHVSADAFDQVVNDYIDGYEIYGEDEEGREGTYTPNEHERTLIYDAIQGLLADSDFVARFNAWQDLVRKSHGQ